jgi:hypothetical protein
MYKCIALFFSFVFSFHATSKPASIEPVKSGKEVNCHLKILNAMGVKVRKVSNTKLKFNTLVTKEHYEMDIPSDLSLEQEKEVKEHWVLFLASQKAFDNMLVWPAIGSLILIPLSVWMFFDLATQLTQNL